MDHAVLHQVYPGNQPEPVTWEKVLDRIEEGLPPLMPKSTPEAPHQHIDATVGVSPLKKRERTYVAIRL